MSQRAIIRQFRVPKWLSYNVKYVRRFFENTKDEDKEFFDGEHVIKFHIRLFLMYFSNCFVKQTPHYHIGNPFKPDDFFENGGGVRTLFGISDSGLGIKTPTQNIVIEPHSFCYIKFPSFPPVIHQFHGTNINQGEGTALFSYHNGKTIEYKLKKMETYTVFTEFEK